MKRKPQTWGQTWLTGVAVFAAGFIASSPAARAGKAPSEAALLERYSSRRAEFRQLAALLAAQGGQVFGPRYGEWAQLKGQLGIRTFQGSGGQNRLGLRFPVAYRSDLFQLTRGSTRGYAWMPNPPALLRAESDRIHRETGQPPTVFRFADPRRPLLTALAPPASRGQYAITLRRIEGPWYLYADNSPFHSGW